MQWWHYAEYCRCISQGRPHEEAKLWMESFVESMNSCDARGRREFVAWLMTVVMERDRGQELWDIVPKELRRGVIDPTLQEWCLAEVSDPRPFRWYCNVLNRAGNSEGAMEYLEKAFEMDASDERTKIQLVVWLSDDVEFELRSVLEGRDLDEPEVELAKAERALSIAATVGDARRRGEWLKFLVPAREALINILEWKVSGDPDLAGWARANNKRVTYWD